MSTFGNKPFTLHHAQAFEQHFLANAYLREKEAFLKSVLRVSRNSVDPTANVISSNMLYKIKSNDDLSLITACIFHSESELFFQLQPPGNGVLSR